jgi:prepilin-type N-terminal cleavage/methylation domain-containing protein
MRKANRAFTLIELLVVIAIIAILAAILFPVFAQAREKGRQAACLSNMKQFTLGMMMYVQDYDEHFPSQDPDPSRPQLMDDLWLFVIVPYIKTPPADWASTRSNIYVCPSNPNLQLVSKHRRPAGVAVLGLGPCQRVPPNPGTRRHMEVALQLRY